MSSTTTSAENHFHRASVPLQLRDYTGKRSLADVITTSAAVRNPGNNAQSASTPLESTVLMAMREHCHADIAFLQNRDLSDPNIS